MHDRERKRVSDHRSDVLKASLHHGPSVHPSVGEPGGEWGKQVGSMNEESQFSGLGVKLRPMREHDTINLYVHGSQKAH